MKKKFVRSEKFVSGSFKPPSEHRDGWCQFESENSAKKKRSSGRSSAPFSSTAALETAPIHQQKHQEIEHFAGRKAHVVRTSKGTCSVRGAIVEVERRG